MTCADTCEQSSRRIQPVVQPLWCPEAIASHLSTRAMDVEFWTACPPHLLPARCQHFCNFLSDAAHKGAPFALPGRCRAWFDMLFQCSTHEGRLRRRQRLSC